MHTITTTIRRIPASDLPTVTELDGTERPASTQDLLNLGLVPLGGDLYESLTQARRDDDSLTWTGDTHPGTAITEGAHSQRYARLPAEHVPVVLHALVIRADDPAVNAAALAEANVAYVAEQLAVAVGDVNGAPLIDLSHPDAVLDEAQRLVVLPGNGIGRLTVPMIDVTPADVVEADTLIPHRWHGEPPR